MKLHLWYHNNALANTRCLENRFIITSRINENLRDSPMLINAPHIIMDEYQSQRDNSDWRTRIVHFGPLPVAAVCCHTLSRAQAQSLVK